MERPERILLKALVVAAMFGAVMLGAVMLDANDALAGHRGEGRGEAAGARQTAPWPGTSARPSRPRSSREGDNFRGRANSRNIQRGNSLRNTPRNIQRAQRRRDRDAERDRRRDRDAERDRLRSRRDRRSRSRSRDDQDRARDAVRGGQARPLGEIIARVRSVCPGTFLGASLQKQGQGYLYRVRILRPSGRRITFMVDAASGAIVSGRCR